MGSYNTYTHISQARSNGGVTTESVGVATEATAQSIVTVAMGHAQTQHNTQHTHTKQRGGGHVTSRRLDLQTPLKTYKFEKKHRDEIGQKEVDDGRGMPLPFFPQVLPFSLKGS